MFSKFCLMVVGKRTILNRMSPLCRPVVHAMIVGAFVGVAQAETADHWTYDAAAKTITDGNWTLKTYARYTSGDLELLGVGASLTSTAAGNAYVSGSGDLNLDKPIYTAEGSTRVISDIAKSALAMGDKLTSIVYPRTLGVHLRMGGTSTATGTVNWENYLAKDATTPTALTNIVMNCPHVLHADSAYTLWNMTTYGALRNLTLKMPKLQTIGDNAFYCADKTATGALEGSNFSDWDLSAVETIGYRAMNNVMASGVIDLPRIESIGVKAFSSDKRVTGVELSPERCTLGEIGEEAFKDATDLQHVTIGGAKGLTIAANAFGGCSSLASVIFTGAKPTFTAADASTPVFGASQAARTMAFYVPKGVDEWKAVVEGATPLSEAEKAAFATAHPELPVPFGVVAANVFHTTNEQLIGYAEHYYVLETTHDSFFGDNVTVAAPENCRRNGKYRAGTSVTVTATANPSPEKGGAGTFSAWYLDVDDALRTSNPLEFKIARPTRLYARFTHPWTYDGTAKTLSNGNWTLNAYPNDATKGYLTLGLASGGLATGSLFATTEGEGVLDLGGPISDGNGKTWQITKLPASRQHLSARPCDGKGLGMTAFLSPGTLASVYANVWGSPLGPNGGFPTCEMIVLDETCSSSFAGWDCYFYYQWRLGRLVLRLPNITNLCGNSGAFLWYADAYDTDLGWWRLDSVETVGAGFARISQILDSAGTNPGFSCHGVLRLPSVKDIKAGAFLNCRYVDGLEFGDATRSLALTNYNAGYSGKYSWAIANNRNLRSIRLGGRTLNVRAGCIYNNPNLRSISFMGAKPVLEAEGATVPQAVIGLNEKQIEILLPADSAELSSATDVLSDEAATFKRDNPDLPRPSGIVPGTTFEMGETLQYVAVHSPVSAQVGLDYDTSFGDEVLVDCDSTPDVFGDLPDRATWTYTASPSATGTFAGWYGDVPDNERMDTTIQVSKSGRPPWVFARFTHPWELRTDTAGNKYIDNGKWKIKVYKVDGSNISIGNTVNDQVASAFHADNTGTGVLDLGGPVTDAADPAKRYTIVSIGTGKSSWARTDGALQAFVSPGTVTVGWGQIFASGRGLKTLIYDEPNRTGTFGAWAYSGQVDVNRMVIRMPKLTTIGANGAFWGLNLGDTDLAWWRLEGITTVGDWLFRRSQETDAASSGAKLEQGVNAYGTLEFPNARKIGTLAFRNCHAIEGLIVGTNKSSYVTTIDTNAFLRCEALAKLVIGSTSDLKVGEMADWAPVASSSYKRKDIERYPSWKDVTFLGPAPTARALGNLMTNVTLQVGAKDCVIRMSNLQPGWSDLIDTTLNDQEQEASKPEGYVGVWRAGATRAEGGKAWVVHQSSAWDPRGTFVIFR